MIKRLITLLLCVAMLFACGCSQETVINTESSGNSDVSFQAATKAETYKIAYNAEQTLNPIVTQSSTNLYLCGLMFDGLVSLDNSMHVTPIIAESTQMSENNTVCTVKIKKGMKFSDGTELSALDVVATVQTIKSVSQSYYYSWMENVLSVSATEAYEVVFALSRPDPNFECLLAFPVIKGGSADSVAFIGSGRYILQYGDDVTLEANTNWYGGECAMKKILLVNIDNSDSIRYELDRQTVDFMYTEGSIETLGAVAVKNVTVNNAVMLAYNNTRSYFSNGDMRRAFDSILDKEELADNDSAGAEMSDVPLNPKLGLLNEIDTSASATLTVGEIATTLGYTQRDETGYYYVEGEQISYFTLRLIYLETDIERKGQIKLIKEAFEKEGIVLDIASFGTKEEFISALNNNEYDLCFCEMKFNNNSDLTPLFTGQLASLFPLQENSPRTIYEMYISGQKTIGDFVSAYIAEMPVSVLYFRNGRAMYSRNFGADVEVGPAFIFNNAEEWILYE